MRPGLDAAARVLRGCGERVDEPVLLRETNNLVAWMAPSPVVAKVGDGRSAHLERELAVGRFLAENGAPVVPPSPLLPVRVHKSGTFEMTFWEHNPERGRDPKPALLARSIAELHKALSVLPDPWREQLGSFADELSEVEVRLCDPSFAPSLDEDGRNLLRAVLARRSSLPTSPTRVVHGSPHRFNMLYIDRQVRLIDFETVCLGPLEWDLAHVDDAIAGAYPGRVDADLLAECRRLVSAKTAAWCWAKASDPTMRWHAEHHLAAVGGTLPSS